MQIVLEQKRIQKRGEETHFANIINCDNNRIRNNGYLYITLITYKYKYLINV